jgi:putative phosphoesterase
VRKQYPAKQVISVGKFKIGLMHGWGPPQGLEKVLEDAFRQDDVDMIIFGHSHTAVNKKKGKVIYFNPGSPTDNVFAAENSFGIIEVNDTIKAMIVKI